MNKLFFGETNKEEEMLVTGGETTSRKITTVEVIDNRIYFYSEIYREDILNLNRTLRQTANDLIRREISGAL